MREEREFGAAVAASEGEVGCVQKTNTEKEREEQ